MGTAKTRKTKCESSFAMDKQSDSLMGVQELADGTRTAAGGEAADEAAAAQCLGMNPKGGLLAELSGIGEELLGRAGGEAVHKAADNAPTEKSASVGQPTTQTKQADKPYSDSLLGVQEQVEDARKQKEDEKTFAETASFA